LLSVPSLPAALRPGLSARNRPDFAGKNAGNSAGDTSCSCGFCGAYAHRDCVKAAVTTPGSHHEAQIGERARDRGGAFMPTRARAMTGRARGAGTPTTAPVFVLCSARSGSTLLRFLLDAHPDLACPPETNLPVLCGQLAAVWSLIEGMPLPRERGDELHELPAIPEAAIGGLRQTMNLMIGSLLMRRGKKRYCDKSLGTAKFADLLLRVYPDAKFLCLYRHPMDVIASAIEACPWGLHGYGFEPYIAATPGNMVLALARYWTDSTAAALATEDRLPGACHRVRYEDLVTNPGGIAEEIFSFLGVTSPGTAAGRWFAAERERFGPADHKIWHTSGVVTTEIGKGWSIPTGYIPAPILDQLNALADKLGYRQVDGQWGAAAFPGSTLADAGEADQPDTAPQHATPAGIRLSSALMNERMNAGLAKSGDGFARRWYPWVTEPFAIAVIPPGGGAGEACWRVDLKAQEITQINDPGDDDTEWEILGPADAWEAVLRDGMNFSAALRKHQLRYCDADGAGDTTVSARIDMVADFLGIASWPSAADPAVSILQMAR
jgi:protein-tyrosine sulfotransferase